MFSVREVLEIHNALHSNDEFIEFQSKYPIEMNNNVKSCKINNHLFRKEDGTSKSKYAHLAKKGDKLTWIEPHNSSEYGLIINDKIEKLCPIIKMEIENTSKLVKHKKLHLMEYHKQKKMWPTENRHILAQYNEESVVVYQAFNPMIVSFAVKNNYFGGDGYSTNRMTWIKTNFLWMMYRSNWAQSKNQECILAIWLKREAFDNLLKKAIHSKFYPEIYEDENTWKQQVQNSSVRLQWDPDHSPDGKKEKRRAIQLGIRRDELEGFCKPNGYIIEIQDITEFVKDQNKKNVENKIDFDQLIIPKEEEYEIKDEKLEKFLGIGL